MYLIRYVVSSCLKRGLFEFMVRSNLPYVEHDVCTKRSTCSDDRSRIFFFYPHFGSLLALCQFQLRHRVLAKVNIDGRRMETQSAVKLETYVGVKAFSWDFRGNWGKNGGRGLKRKCAPFLGVKVLFIKPTPISTPYPPKYPSNSLCSTKLRLFLKSGWML